MIPIFESAENLSPPPSVSPAADFQCPDSSRVFLSPAALQPPRAKDQFVIMNLICLVWAFKFQARERGPLLGLLSIKGIKEACRQLQPVCVNPARANHFSSPASFLTTFWTVPRPVFGNSLSCLWLLEYRQDHSQACNETLGRGQC